MSNRRTVEGYRTIDLALWMLILLVFESVILLVGRSGRFSGDPYTFSLAAAIACVVYMRWGLWGGLHAAAAGAIFSILGGGDWRHLIIYTIGNCLSLLVVPLMEYYGKEKLRETRFLYLLVSILTLLLMQLGRALLSLLFGAGEGEFIQFFTSDSLSLVFTVVFVWIAHRLDGVYEDQHHYLMRINGEQNEKGADL